MPICRECRPLIITGECLCQVCDKKCLKDPGNCEQCVKEWDEEFYANMPEDVEVEIEDS